MRGDDGLERVTRGLHDASGDIGTRIALGAAALAGAAGAAIATKKGLDELRGGDGSGGGSGRSRGYRLEPGEPLGEGLRRIALGRTDDAVMWLRDPDADPATAVHEARKDLKKVRAVLRLARDRLGDDTYRGENTRFREAGRQLSAARDAQIKLETLEALSERFRQRVTAQGVAELRKRFEAERDAKEPRSRDDGLKAADEIEAGAEEIARWPLDGDDWGTVEPGLKWVYRRGRDRFRDALKRPSDEAMHEWRKRAKDLWYAMRILTPAWPDVAKPLGDGAHDLSDLLGDDHDLAVLAASAREAADEFAQPGDLEIVLDAIGQRRAELRTDAFALGRRLYADKPGAFAARLEAWWRAWRLEAGAPA